jgi:hypothetical protein
MRLLDDLVDVGTALGKGVCSAGMDIVYGIERTGEGLGIRGADRVAQIGSENEYLAKLLVELLKHGVTTIQSPLFRIIVEILVEYYSHFPEPVLKKLAKAAAVGAGYMAGRMVIGKALAKAVAVRIAGVIASSVAYKQFARKLCVSAGAGSTGIGIPITLLMLQGVAQRASNGSKRLSREFPELYRKLRAQNGLDMLFFLVERPLEKYLKAISLAKSQKQALFEQEVSKLYETRRV